ncbi:MAG: class I SAM-dependent methyltransferase, partial [Candidatus Aenigmarchaeota archaeon]|nr:class I SAM-dependent methyltransferase [Candidatus Aenigmarchaeota archaeon]
IPTKKPIILDLGCGTGISTRQLTSKKGVIIGCDRDAKMLNIALRYKRANISYKRGAAEKLPFVSGEFDAVTSFMAFHWFMNRKAITEIKRVLKPHGVLCIIQLRFARSTGLRIILERELKQKIPKKYKNSDEIIPFLTKNGFQVKRRVVKSHVKYTLTEYVRLLKSYSAWNYVPLKRRTEIENVAKMHFSKKLQNGYIRNVKDVEVIIGIKIVLKH